MTDVTYKHALCSTFLASGENMKLECTHDGKQESLF